MAILDEIKEAVVDGETDEIEELVQQAIDEGIDPNVIINDGLIGGMDIVAPLFRDGEMFVPGMETKGKVVIGTIDGDLHDIGKNLVVLMLESNGYEVIDLGIDVEAETFAQAVEENKPQIVGLSSMLTTTMMQMDTTIKCLEDKGLRNQIKIIIGGAPITQEFADEIGADGFSKDASACVELCDSIVNAA